MMFLKKLLVFLKCLIQVKVVHPNVRQEFKLEEDNINLDEDNYFSYDISDSDDEKESSLDEKVNENDSSSEEEIDLDDI